MDCTIVGAGEDSVGINRIPGQGNHHVVIVPEPRQLRPVSSPIGRSYYFSFLSSGAAGDAGDDQIVVVGRLNDWDVVSSFKLGADICPCGAAVVASEGPRAVAA